MLAGQMVGARARKPHFKNTEVAGEQPDDGQHPIPGLTDSVQVDGYGDERNP
jgi:hypothetical protein